MHPEHKKAFTLIELLVVIAIIAMLASIIFASLDSARAKARDSKRILDLKEFEKGLLLFFDTYGMYPCGDSQSAPNRMGDSTFSEGFLNGERADNPLAGCTVSPEFGLKGAGLYSSAWPKDPLNDYAQGRGYYYAVRNDRQVYDVFTRLETNPTLMKNDGGICDNYYEIGVGDLSTLFPLDELGENCEISL